MAALNNCFMITFSIFLCFIKKIQDINVHGGWSTKSCLIEIGCIFCFPSETKQEGQLSGQIDSSALMRVKFIATTRMWRKVRDYVLLDQQGDVVAVFWARLFLPVRGWGLILWRCAHFQRCPRISRGRWSVSRLGLADTIESRIQGWHSFA